jgi:methyl-accepting chemotaxis protein
VREEVCDIDLVYDTAKLKVNVLRLKDEVYTKLGSYEKWTARNCDTVTNWINDYSVKNTTANPESIKNLQKLNDSLRIKLQNLINANANKESNDSLNQNAKLVEIESLRIFGTLNRLKKDACKK